MSELLAPAGRPEAGYAALHYGADAVYLGLNRFSARAEAVNFTPEELGEFVAYAHGLTPARKVYLTLNTLVRQNELADAAETLLVAAECGVDAVIVQDLGVARLVRERFPGLGLHASTQLAVHNAAGAAEAAALGFRRVTLARELTLEEVARVRRETGVELETFIHGTLCYSYSGLCLFSSLATGRSGNRGRCVYSCREAAQTPHGRRHPFSLKDLHLGPRALDLARAGIASLKIEGRKKSPLYVAATVDYYRRILDGGLRPEELPEYEARLQTIFARPWTRLFLDGPRNPDAADTEVVGHRGARVGSVGRVVSTPAGPAVLFKSVLPVERHDGVQIDLPGEARPFGFGVDELFLIGRGGPKRVFEAPAGSPVAVGLPPDAPVLTPGLPVYLASSQAVKRSYPFAVPKAGAFGPRLAASIALRLSRDGDGSSCAVRCRAEAALPESFPRVDADRAISAGVDESVPAFPARDAAGAEEAARAAFERTGGSRFLLSDWRFDNPDRLFVRPGDWNRLRRTLLDGLEAAYRKRFGETGAFIAAACAADRERPSRAERRGGFLWSLAVDSPDVLAGFGPGDLDAAEEVIVELNAAGDMGSALEALAGRVPRETLRVAVPLILRGEGYDGAAEAVRRLADAGWRRWLVPGLGALPLFGGMDGMDLAADWPLYALNRLAARRLLDLGMSSFTLSPEDDAENLRSLLAEFPDQACLTVYANPPLFVSAACAHAHLGACGGKKSDCRRCGREMEIVMEKSGPVTVSSRGGVCVATRAAPTALTGRLEELEGMGARRLRVDLRWRRHGPAEAARIWNRAMRGEPRAADDANFRRGLA